MSCQPGATKIAVKISFLVPRGCGKSRREEARPGAV